MIDTTKTRRQIIKKLIIMDLITSSKQLKKGMPGRGAAPWREDEIDVLKNLYDVHKDDRGVL